MLSFGVKQWLHNEGPRYAVAALLLLANGIYFAVTFAFYAQSPAYFYHREILGPSLSLARASAACLNLNCSLVALPVCRGLLSRLLRLLGCRRKYRSLGRELRRLGTHAVGLHRLLGQLICLHTVLHALAHYNNIESFVRAHQLPANASASLNRALSILGPEQGAGRRINPIERSDSDSLIAALLLLPGWTGVLLSVLLTLMAASSVKSVARANYESFWYTHKLFYAFFLLLCLHGLAGVVSPQQNVAQHNPSECANLYKDWGTDRAPQCPVPVFHFTGAGTWKWLILPAILYAIERALRLWRLFQPVEIVQVLRHPSRVIELRMRKRGFRALPGEFVNLLVPNASRIQWHPFTLTSSPDDPNFSVHIRIVGDWTEEVERIFQPYAGKGEIAQADRLEMPKICVDGPFGAPAEGMQDFAVSVLIGCGIGVTPFASVLRHLWWQVSYGRSLGKLRNLHFYWMCPDYRAFEWFADSLQELERDLSQRPQHRELLTISVHLTGGLDSKRAHEVVEREADLTDLFTGLRAKTHYGRPDWRSEMERLQRLYTDTSIGVFFCGPSSVGKQVNAVCNKSAGNCGSVFHFHAESF